MERLPRLPRGWARCRTCRAPQRPGERKRNGLCADCNERWQKRRTSKKAKAYRIRRINELLDDLAAMRVL